MDSNQTVIGVNLEVPNIQIGLIVGKKLVKLIEAQIDPGQSKEVILSNIIEQIRKLVNKDVVGIGFGTTGIVDAEKGIVRHVTRIPAWKNVQLKEEISKEFNLPCFLNNDCNCFTLGAKYFGSGKKFKNIVGLILGEGIGAGIVIDNKLYSGADSLAGELGQITWQEINYEKILSTSFFKEHHNSSFNDVFNRAEKGDKKALDIFSEYGFQLGWIIENIILTINPELIALGGDISKGFKYFKNSMYKRIKNIYNESSFAKIEINEEQNENLTVLGAAALYYDAQQAKAFEIEKSLRKKAEQEISTILTNVDEGIFLLNSSMEMGSQYSKQLEVILDNSKLSGANFINYMEDKITEDELINTENFTNFLFDDQIDEQAIFELNPLNPIQVNVSKSSEPKSLVFNFKRIHNKLGKTEELFVRVKDVTEQKKLEEKVRISELKAKKQTELVLGIVSVAPKMLKEFIEGIKEEFKLVDNLFEKYKKDNNPKALLKNLYQSIHLFKGNASMLQLKFFAESAHMFEDRITKVSNQDRITGKDIKSIWMDYQNINNDLDEMQSLLSSIGEIHSSAAKNRRDTDNPLVKTLQNYVKEASKDLNKIVKLKVDEFDSLNIPHKFKTLTRDILIQLIRNSIAHGLETPEERIKKGKDKTGSITISSDLTNGSYSFSVYDDGNGLQLDKLKKKMKSHEDWAGVDVDKLEKSEIIESIFHSGLSTGENIDFISGRGIGMDAVRGKINSHDGTISIDTEQSKYCSIKIELPNANK